MEGRIHTGEEIFFVKVGGSKMVYVSLSVKVCLLVRDAETPRTFRAITLSYTAKEQPLALPKFSF